MCYNSKIKDIEDKIPDITNLATTTDLNSLINKVTNTISSISSLATTTVLTAVENKITDFSNLVKKANYDTNICDIEKISIMIMIISILLFKNSIS